MDQHQQPLPATCQDHQRRSGIDFSKMETDSSQLQQASPTVEGTSSDNPHLKLVLELKSPKTAKQQRKFLQTLKSNPYLMAAFIIRQSSSDGDLLSQVQEHINQQEWKSDMEELKALTTTELEDTPVAAVADVAAEAHSKPSIKSLMRFGIQHSSRLHHQDHQTSSGVSQGSDEKDAQLDPDPDNDDLLLTEPRPGNPQERRKLSHRKFIESLVHGYQCRDVNCCLSICQKWKMIDKHIKICKRRIYENCRICKQLTEYCFLHAKQCQESECPVPVCANMKHTLIQHQLRSKLEQTLLLQRLAGLSMSGVLPGPPGLVGGNSQVVDLHQLSTNMDQHQQPLPATCQDHQHRSGIDFSKMETDSSQLQQASPTVEGTSSDNPHLKLVLELKSPKTAKQQRKILQTLKSNPYLMAAFIKRQSSSEDDHLAQFQEHINQQEWKSDMDELVKALTTTELEDTPVAAVADVAAEVHSKPSIKSLMRSGIQHSSRLHHQDHQTSSGVSQGSDEKDAQLNPDPDNDDLLLTEPRPGNPQETRKLSLPKFIQSLVHGYQCRDVNCCLSICQKWKMIDKHIKICKRRIYENCLICKQLTEYCFHHAKYCQESECPVPVCANMKHTLIQQQLHSKLEQTLLLQRLAGLSMSGVLPGPPGLVGGNSQIQEKAINSYILETLEKPEYQLPPFSQLTPHLLMQSSDGPLPIFRYTGLCKQPQQNPQVSPQHSPLGAGPSTIQQSHPGMVGTANSYPVDKITLQQLLITLKDSQNT